MVKIQNKTASEIIVMNTLFRENGEINDTREILESDLKDWGNDSQVLLYLADGSLVVSVNDVEITDLAESINILKQKYIEGDMAIKSSPPFSSKILPSGEKIYRRKYGFSIVVDANSSLEHTLTVPYSKVLINEIELLNAISGDKVDFNIYDSVDGKYQQLQGIPSGSVNPDLKLNQFGYGVYLPNGFYRDISSYDAELFGTARIKILYYNNTNESRTIYGNIIYHELVN